MQLCLFKTVTKSDFFLGSFTRLLQSTYHITSHHNLHELYVDNDLKIIMAFPKCSKILLVRKLQMSNFLIPAQY